MRLYLDANAIIYSVEGVPPFRSSVLDWIQRAGRTPEGRILTSRISRLECRSKPLGAGDHGLLSRYDEFLAALTISPLTDDIVESATDICARFRIRSVDALHLATAAAQRADVFLTGDRRLERCTDVNVVIVQAPDSK